MKILTTALFSLFCIIRLCAQNSLVTDENDLKLAALPYYNFGKGLGITSSDSLFQLNIRFRMQNRVGYYNNSLQNEYVEAIVRRLRLRFDGFVGSPQFLYVIQLSFAPGDVGVIEEGENVNIIRDAAFIYRPNKRFSVTFGQTKLPGNRQRLNSSGALQLTDRSINNARFNIDRDFGVQVFFINENEKKFSYNLKGSISTGEGRNWTKTKDMNLAYTAKLELMPFGSFQKNGIYFESDLLREQRPKLFLAAVFSQNNWARRTQGQLGDELFAARTIKTLFLDAMLKYKGFAFMASYMERFSNNPIAYSANLNDFNYVFTGSGIDAQLSYVFKNNIDVITRYSNQQVNSQIAQYEPSANQFSLGLTKYIREHALKLQAEFTYTTFDYLNASTRNAWYSRFQIELGI